MLNADSDCKTVLADDEFLESYFCHYQGSDLLHNLITMNELYQEQNDWLL